MTMQEKKEYLEEMGRKRGYILDMHRIMASEDFEWVKKYDPFLEATYTTSGCWTGRPRSCCRSLWRRPCGPTWSRFRPTWKWR